MSQDISNPKMAQDNPSPDPDPKPNLDPNPGPSPKPKTTFELSRPLETDAPRIAQIHLAAMDTNPLLHAQFPTLEGRQNLERFLAEHTAKQIRRGKEGILVAREPETGAIVGFARWDPPAPEEVTEAAGGGKKKKGKKGKGEEKVREGEGEGDSEGKWPNQGDVQDQKKLEESEGLKDVEGLEVWYLYEYVRLAGQAKRDCFSSRRRHYRKFFRRRARGCKQTGVRGAAWSSGPSGRHASGGARCRAADPGSPPNVLGRAESPASPLHVHSFYDFQALTTNQTSTSSASIQPIKAAAPVYSSRKK